MSSVNSKKFAGLSASEITSKQANLQNAITKRKEKTASEHFKAFLAFEGEEDVNFYKYEAKTLDAFLARFWFNVRTDNGEHYKVKSLECLRYALNRDLKAHGCQFDIVSKGSAGFQTSQQAFEDAKRELKKVGKGHVTHRAEISPEGKCIL